MMHYETADMKRNNKTLDNVIEEMRNLTDGATVYNDFSAGTTTIVFKDGRHVTHSMNEKPSTKPSTSRRVKSSTASELEAIVKKTMREADQNISDFIKRIAQLDIEISRSTMHGQYTDSMKKKRDDLLQRINKLEAIKSRSVALLLGT